MGDLNLKECLIYLDDIIFYSADIDSHLERLDAVFKRLADFNLTIKPSKCEFFKTDTNYLGYIVSSEPFPKRQISVGKVNRMATFIKET